MDCKDDFEVGEGEPPPRRVAEDSMLLVVLLLNQVRTTIRCRPMVNIRVSGKESFLTSCGDFANNWEFIEEFM